MGKLNTGKSFISGHTLEGCLAPFCAGHLQAASSLLQRENHFECPPVVCAMELYGPYKHTSDTPWSLETPRKTQIAQLLSVFQAKRENIMIV